MIELSLYFLLIFMIVGALVAINLNELLSSVVALGVVGLGLSVAFLLLQAPDLAIVQLVVEILCLVILVRATIKKDLPKTRTPHEYLVIAITLCFAGAFAYIGYLAFKELPEFGAPIIGVARTYLVEGLKKTGAVNLVSAVILNFRAMDTLGEATVLFTAVIGTLTVLRKIGKIRKDKE